MSTQKQMITFDDCISIMTEYIEKMNQMMTQAYGKKCKTNPNHIATMLGTSLTRLTQENFNEQSSLEKRLVYDVLLNFNERLTNIENSIATLEDKLTARTSLEVKKLM